MHLVLRCAQPNSTRKTIKVDMVCVQRGLSTRQVNTAEVMAALKYHVEDTRLDTPTHYTAITVNKEHTKRGQCKFIVLHDLSRI